MSPQAEDRPPTDRIPGAGGYSSQSGHQQPQIQPTSQPQNQAYSGRANGFGPANVGKQRSNGDPGAGSDRVPNGNLAAPSGEGRDARNRDVSQNMPIRERSRTNGASGGRSGNSAQRICKKCDQPLTGQFVRALGGTYHLECFLCRVRSPRVLCLFRHIILIWRHRIVDK